jgi:tetratricopeptide (TPR) repeat protein
MHKEAIEACKQAIRVNPDYAEAHFNLGVVYTDLGMHKEAIEVFKQAISINHDYADFAIMYRLLHSSRMPVKYDAGDDSLIENFHQDSLDSGSRIREGLSEAIEKSIISLAGGFLKHPANDQLRERIVASNAEGTGEEGIDTEQFYQFQLRLVYRLLFLIVVEERNLIYPDTVPGEIRETYYKYYSVNRIRYLS